MAELSPIRILHVDDNETNRYVVARMLQKEGMHVLEAATGELGLQFVTEQLPDLVILDVQLPDLNGFEVCHQIKANSALSLIPVLMLSASFVESQDKAQGLDSGADAYLAQPVEPIELLATIRALLRIRRAEESALILASQWQITFDSMSDGIGLLDQQGAFLRCNRALLNLLDRPNLEVVGQPHQDMMHGLLGLETSLFSHLQETGLRQSIELQSQNHWYNITIEPILNAQSLFIGAVYILADITDRKRAQAERDTLLQLEQAARNEAEAANRIKDEFLAVLSHELRSPLNPILGWAKLLQSRRFDEVGQQRALETIERNASLQAQLIEDLLDVSRIMRGKLSLNITPVNLVAIIEAALETVRLAAEAKAIELRFTICDFELDHSKQTLEATPNNGQGSNSNSKLQTPKFQVLGDGARLQQIIWNLLSNGVKFTPEGGQVDVRLSLVTGHSSTVGNQEQRTKDKGQRTELTHTLKPKTQHPRSYAQITVSDTGKGIKPEFLPHVFEYFRQADSTTTRQFGGLGLGLAIVRNLVELHGGTIQAASSGEDQGATFTVRLPLRTAGIVEQDEGGEPLPAAAVSYPSLTGVRVLLVDDDVDTRNFFAFVLEQQGAMITPVASANEALQICSQTEPDILLSDIGMPEIDGYTLIQQVRALQKGRQIPAIAITAYAGESDQQKTLAAGFQRHIAKPVAPDTLIATITSLLAEGK